MGKNAFPNLSNAAIPGWNAFLIIFMIVTIALCTSKKYQNMTRLLSLQAICLSLLTFTLGVNFKETHLYLAGVANLIFKAVIIPLMLRDSLKKSNLYQRKDEHFSLIHAGLWIGMITIIAVFVTPSLMEVAEVVSGRTLQLGIAGVFLGLWMMVYRNYLYSQVVGLLLMENSLYLIALALTHGLPLIVELGILFDVFVCILVMGVLLKKVRRLFDSTEIDQLGQLRG